MKENTEFAKAYEELQALTKEFESADLDLELAIPKFKRAAELAQFLKKRLKVLETQIEEINIDLEKEINQEETSSDATNPQSDIEF